MPRSAVRVLPQILAFFQSASGEKPTNDGIAFCLPPKNASNPSQIDGGLRMSLFVMESAR